MKYRRRAALSRAASFAVLAAVIPSCEDDPSPTPSSGVTGARERARHLDDFMIHYGEWGEADVELARRYDVVVVHPSAGKLTRAVVASIQRGANPADPSDDVLVLGYLSIGEDLRTGSLSDEQMSADPRFRGDGSGPRVDPRGPLPEGGPLEGVDLRGAPSPGGGGFASWYVDDNDRDGKPDRNAQFGGCFVNAGDPAWFEVLQGMTLDGPDGLAGLREILTTGSGRGLGCDGIFLDTMDSAAPNHFTDESSPNRTELEWTAPGYLPLLRRIRSAYPGVVLLQNRGLFFLDPRHPHYRFGTGPEVDLVLFESFRLNSDASVGIDPYFHADNRHNVAPKLLAEAARGAGFRVVSLGYAEGPPGRMSPRTLVGGSTLGSDLLSEDIRLAERVYGFRHYLSDAAVTLVNDFVRVHARRDDDDPPVWSSTWNARSVQSPPGAPEPRVGIRDAEPGPASAVVRWDVALDLHPVRYTLYYQAEPFDFRKDPDLDGAVRLELVPRPGRGYAEGPGPDRYPYEALVPGLRPGTTYHFVIRASDRSPAAHQEKNRVVLTASPF